MERACCVGVVSVVRERARVEPPLFGDERAADAIEATHLARSDDDDDDEDPVVHCGGKRTLLTTIAQETHVI